MSRRTPSDPIVARAVRDILKAQDDLLRATERLRRARERLQRVSGPADPVAADGTGGRRDVAARWLIARFAERKEWPSDLLFQRARDDGVFRNAIFEAKRSLNIPRARRVTDERGDASWVWWVPDDWTPAVLQEIHGVKSNGAPL